MHMTQQAMLSFGKRRGGGMADATDLKSVDRKVVWVRLPPSAPIAFNNLQRSLPHLRAKPDGVSLRWACSISMFLATICHPRRALHRFVAARAFCSRHCF